MSRHWLKVHHTHSNNTRPPAAAAAAPILTTPSPHLPLEIWQQIASHLNIDVKVGQRHDYDANCEIMSARSHLRRLRTVSRFFDVLFRPLLFAGIYFNDWFCRLEWTWASRWNYFRRGGECYHVHRLFRSMLRNAALGMHVERFEFAESIFYKNRTWWLTCAEMGRAWTLLRKVVRSRTLSSTSSSYSSQQKEKRNWKYRLLWARELRKGAFDIIGVLLLWQFPNLRVLDISLTSKTWLKRRTPLLLPGPGSLPSLDTLKIEIRGPSYVTPPCGRLKWGQIQAMTGEDILGIFLSTAPNLRCLLYNRGLYGSKDLSLQTAGLRETLEVSMPHLQKLEHLDIVVTRLDNHEPVLDGSLGSVLVDGGLDGLAYLKIQLEVLLGMPVRGSQRQRMRLHDILPARLQTLHIDSYDNIECYRSSCSNGERLEQIRHLVTERGCPGQAVPETTTTRLRQIILERTHVEIDMKQELEEVTTASGIDIQFRGRGPWRRR